MSRKATKLPVRSERPLPARSIFIRANGEPYKEHLQLVIERADQPVNEVIDVTNFDVQTLALVAEMNTQVFEIRDPMEPGNPSKEPPDAM